jgi:hypothetical protein
VRVEFHEISPEIVHHRSVPGAGESCRLCMPPPRAMEYTRSGNICGEKIHPVSKMDKFFLKVIVKIVPALGIFGT